jgi:sortase A
VTSSHVVLPSNVTVLDATTSPQLTLTTCNPRYSAAQRLVVVATLRAAVMAATVPTTSAPPNSTTTSGPSSSAPTTPPSLAGGAEGLGGGGLGGVSARGEAAKAVLWGVLAFLAGILGAFGWLKGRRPWSWVVFGMGVPITLAALLICYQHISLALPQSF